MTQVVVVVPARDEQEAIGDTLRGVCDSLDRARRSGLVEASAVEVVAHRCTDATEARARAVLRGHAAPFGTHVVADEDSVSVGQVRDRAVRRGLGRLEHRPRDTWVLSTDADTRVGPGWVTDILTAAASTGVVGVVGLARLDGWYGGPAGAAAYEAVIAAKMRSSPADPLHQHDHVYAANLAVRADAYLDVGGFSHLAHGEDQALVDALAARGRPLLRTRTVVVTTSGRLVGRAGGGLAEHLARLDAVSPAAADGVAS